MATESEYEAVLCVKNEVNVYRIPPRTSNRGYRAADWKLENPDWVGRMRIVAKGKQLTIKLEDKFSGELFASCPVEEFPSAAVEQVLDSSRYFVIRIKDPSGRSAFIGIGFSERGDAFDLNVSLQDHFKWVRNEEAAKESMKSVDTGPKLDLGFKEGQTIKINLGGKTGSSKPRPKATGSGGGLGILPPPPGSGARIQPPPGAGNRSSPIHQPNLIPHQQGSSDTVDLINSTAPPPAQVQSSPAVSGTTNVDLLFDLDAPPQQPMGQTTNNSAAPDLWGDFTGANSTSASAGNWTSFQ